MGIDFNKLAEKKSRQGRGWQPKEGPNMVRILPPSSKYFTEQLSDFAVEFYVHFMKVEGEETKVSRCLRNIGKQCPVCDVVRQYRRSEDPGLAKLAEAVKGKERHVMNILDLSQPQNGVQTYETGYKVYNSILEFAANPMWGDVFNPAEGRNFQIELVPANRSKTGWNDYKVQPDPNLTSVMQMLENVTDWKTALDNAQMAVADALEEAELLQLLRNMGFPVGGGAQPAQQQPTGFAPPQPQQSPQGFAPSPATGFSYTAPAEGFGAPTPVQPAPVQAPAPVQPVQQFGGGAQPAVPFSPPPVATPEPVVSAPPAASTSVAAYPPGLEINAATNKPVCYGNFDPHQHPCDQGCSAKEACQLKMLGMGD